MITIDGVNYFTAEEIGKAVGRHASRIRQILPTIQGQTGILKTQRGWLIREDSIDLINDHLTERYTDSGNYQRITDLLKAQSEQRKSTGEPLNRLTDRQREKIRKQAKELTPGELAAIYKVSRGTIYNILKKERKK